MTTDARPGVTPQLVIGVFIVLLGVVLMLDRLDIVDAGRLRPFWPAALMAVGVSMLLQRRDASGRFWGTVWTVVGGWLLLNTIGFFRISIGQLIGPLILILIGAAVMLNTFRSRRTFPRGPADLWAARGRAGGPGDAASGVTATPGTAPGTGDAPNQIPLESDPNGTVTLFAIMGETKRASNDRPFHGGEMTSVMGGCVLDLRQAMIPPGEQAILNLVTVMGGHEIWVPAGWAVTSDLVPIMGGVDDKRLPPVEPPPEPRPRLRLRGIVLMGGVTIKT